MNTTEIAYSFNRAVYIKNTSGNIAKNRKGFIILLTHELVHVWQENYYQSSISLLFKPKWITEGYAVYVSGSNNMNTEKKEFLFWAYKFGIQNIGAGDDYRLWGLMIRHAIEHMHKSVDDLHLGKVEYDEVMDSLLKEYNISKE